MQGPPVNLVLLGLLILFFGLQLRRRNEQPYSGWLLGWVLVFLSYLDWDVMTYRPAWFLPLELLRVDLLALGFVAFLLSFLQRDAGLKRMFLTCVLLLAPGLILLDLQLVHPSRSWVYVVLALFGGVLAVITSRSLISRIWKRRRVLVYGLCAATVTCVIAAIRMDPKAYLREAFLAPLLVGVAILYLASSRSSPLVRALGGVGFLFWAEFYLFIDFLPPTSVLSPLLYQFWDLPKYFAGTAMILELFDAARLDVERLARRYRLLYENLNSLYEDHPHPMWIIDAASRRILSANAAAVQGYGYTRNTLLNMRASELELEQEPAEQAGTDSLAPAPLAPGSRRALFQRSNGEIVSVVVTERPLIYKGIDAVALLAVDVTQQDKLHQDLFHRAHHDALTQLPNRELLADRVAQVLARSERDSKCAVLLTIDVDHFKQINDTYGHPVGDDCLKIVADRLQSRIRSVDTLARTGGEEFTAIIGGLSRRKDAEIVAESLRRLFDTPLLLPELTLPVTVSIGGALFPEDGTEIDTLTKHSDEALYRAKRAGRNRCMFTTPVATA